MRKYSKDFFYLLLLFVFALGLRLLYQDKSVVDTPFRADAGKYFNAAYNLRFHGAHSIEPPGLSPPSSRTDLPPGYPLLLSLFLQENRTMGHFYQTVLTLQAVAGSITVLLTFLLARRALSSEWALLAALFTAMSPHLIALEGYLLTESAFIVAVMLGTCILVAAQRYGQPASAFMGGLILASAAHVRAIGHALPFVFLPLFFLHPPSFSTKSSKSKNNIISAGAIIVAFFCVLYGHSLFADNAVMNTPEIEVKPSEYTDFSTQWDILKKTFRPPNYLVEGKSHVFAEHGDVRWKSKTTEGFFEDPCAYLKWNLGGRFLAVWRFDNAYNGDVYIYPMRQKGFEQHWFLKFTHRLMRLLHWPLFGLALLAGFRLIINREAFYAFAFSFAGFLYFIIIPSFLTPLPRYALPARPFSYILAAGALSWLLTRNRFAGQEK
jgi:hypothetical protein